MGVSNGNLTTRNDIQQSQQLITDEGDQQSITNGQQQIKNKFSISKYMKGETMVAISQEFRAIVAKAIPSSLQNFVWFLSRLFTISVIGYLGGKDQIAGISLGFTFMSVVGWSILVGISGALDTYCSQSFTGNKKMTGIYLQRYFVVASTACIPITIIFYKSSFILTHLGQEPRVCVYAQIYTRTMIIDLIPSVIFIGMEKFFQAQGLFYPILLIEVIMLPVFCVAQYSFVHTFNFGFVGAPIGVIICDFIQTAMMLIYARYFKGHEAWSGFSMQAFSDLGAFSKTSLSSTLQVCTEWWAIEITTLLAGVISVTALASQSILMSTATLCWCIFYGVQVAGGVQVGNLLGEGQAKRARLTSNLCQTLNLGVAIVVCLGILVFKERWAMIYTMEEDVLYLVKKLIPIVMLGEVFDALQGTSGGILRGLGHQKIGAMVNTISYYAISIPLSFLLAFKFKMGLKGIWMSLVVGFITQAFILVAYLQYVDYDKAVQESQKRIQSEYLQNSNDQNFQQPLVDDEALPVSDLHMQTKV